MSLQSRDAIITGKAGTGRCSITIDDPFIITEEKSSGDIDPVISQVKQSKAFKSRDNTIIDAVEICSCFSTRDSTSILTEAMRQ